MLAAQENTPADQQQMIELGLKYDSAWALYQALKAQAGGGRQLTWTDVPDWGGVYVAESSSGRAQPEPKFTPEFHARWMKRIDDAKKGIEYEATGSCVPAGMPRWLTYPHLRQHIVTPDQTWMLTEVFNLVRMIYTDGREHIPDDEGYPTELGDSVGFWDRDRLVIHTNQLKADIYGPTSGEWTDEAETVEIWRKADNNRLEADVWIYDPPALLQPWYAKRTYTRLEDPDKRIRVRHWACHTPNNGVYQTEEGGSQYTGFTFESRENVR
jgi:hypothetical protein